MIKKIYFCDKCGKEVGERAGKTDITNMNGTTITLDICNKCLYDVLNVFSGSDIYDDMVDIIGEPEEDEAESDVPAEECVRADTEPSDVASVDPEVVEAEQPDISALEEKVLDVDTPEVQEFLKKKMNVPEEKQPAAKKRTKIDAGKACALKKAGWSNTAIVDEFGVNRATIDNLFYRMRKEGKLPA